MIKSCPYALALCNCASTACDPDQSNKHRNDSTDVFDITKALIEIIFNSADASSTQLDAILVIGTQFV